MRCTMACRRHVAVEGTSEWGNVGAAGAERWWLLCRRPVGEYIQYLWQSKGRRIVQGVEYCNRAAVRGSREEEGELKARVPGVDVRIPPACAYASERLGEYLRPPATRLHFRPHTQDIFGQCHWRQPFGTRRLLGSPVCCLEELRFTPMQCNPRIHHFVTLSECHSPIEHSPTIAR